jgi:two-component system chemotaxis response regulator CheY
MDNALRDLRILVIDDSTEAVNLVRTMLQELGVHQVFTSKDGRDALDFLGVCDELVDVILCDWNMPRVNGIELLRQVRTVDPQFPFIMVTGTADVQSVREARAAGVTGYILKPFSKQELEKKLRVMARLVAVRAT